MKLRLLGSGIAAVLALMASESSAQVATRITNDRSTMARQSPWKIGDLPLLTIGSSVNQAKPLYRVAGGGVLSDGSIVVANAGTFSVDIYSRTGQWVAEFGREGSGPGEFRGMNFLEIGQNDSIFIFDHLLQRLTVFQPEGGLARTTSVGAYGPVGLIRSVTGTHLFAKSPNRLSPRAQPGALLRDTVQYFSLDKELRMMDVVAIMPGILTAAARAPNGDLGHREAPLSPRPTHARWGNCLVTSSGDSWNLRLYSSDGRMVGEVINDWPRSRISASDREVWYESILSDAPPEQHPLLRNLLEQFMSPEELPSIKALIVDPAGYLWVQHFRPETEWSIIAPSGEILGRVSMPRSLEVLEIGMDHILGLEQDEFAVEVVQLLALDRGPMIPTEMEFVGCS